METTTNDNNVWSISMIKIDRTRTYMYREYGFTTDTPISSIAIASPNNLSSGYEKGTDKFVELLFTDNPQRNFLKKNSYNLLIIKDAKSPRQIIKNYPDWYIIKVF